MTLEILQGDVRAVLATLPDKHFHTVITSPPYFGLRAYKTEPQVWGGDPDHAHAWETVQHYQDSPMRAGEGVGFDNVDVTRAERWREYDICDCGAWRGELGLEPTLDLYLDHLVEIFRDVRRVLRDDGTFWLNCGDSFAGSGKGQMGDGAASDRRGAKQGTSKGTTTGGLPVLRSGVSAKSTLHDGRGVSDDDKIRQPHQPGTRRNQDANLASKSLMLIPARLALVLQADGWVLRNDIIWLKRSAMPGSQTDRLTVSYEHIFLFAKRSRYFFDSYAAHETAKSGFDAFDPKRRSGRMGRDVWQLPGGSFKGAHYASFPPSLPTQCVRLGTSAGGCCAACGAPYRRSTRRNGLNLARPQARRALELARAHGLTEAHIDAIRAVGVNETDRQHTLNGGVDRNTADVQRLAAEAKTALGGYFREFTFSLHASDGFAPDCTHEVRRRRNVGGRTDGFTLPEQPGGLPPVTLSSDGFAPGCAHGGDFEPIATPTGAQRDEDPSRVVGRAGLSRPRGADEGARVITRYEQQQYAAQIKASAHSAEMAAEAGTAFAHYARTDRSGARPIPPDLLDRWLACGWLTRVEVPPDAPAASVPCRVLDPFVGSGTTLLAAWQLGRDATGIELSAEYVAIAQKRLREAGAEVDLR